MNEYATEYKEQFPELELHGYDARKLAHLNRLARILDHSIPLPGGFRIGFDGLIGMVPVVGDTVGAAFSTYLIVRAAELGASVRTLIKMMSNVLLETLIGLIPVLGDLFDFAWKANTRNMALLQNQLQSHKKSEAHKKRLTLALGLIILAFVVLLIGSIVIAVKLVMAMVALF